MQGIFIATSKGQFILSETARFVQGLHIAARFLRNLLNSIETHQFVSTLQSSYFLFPSCHGITLNR